MIDKNQRVTIKWMTRNKKKYEAMGYQCRKLNTPLTISVYDLEENSNAHVDVQCDVCGAHIITPYRNYNRIVEKSGEYRCRKCNAPYTSDTRRNNNKERQLEYFNEKITELGYTPTATIDDYRGCDAPMPFICEKHGEQMLSTNQLRQGCICPVCGQYNKNSASRFSAEDVSKAINAKNDDILLNPDEYVDRFTRNLRIKCGSCGKEFITSFASIDNSAGYCPDCAIKAVTDSRRHSIDDIIEMATINGFCYIVNPKEYTGMNDNNLKFICRECGEIFTRSMSHWLEGDGRCIKCNGKMSIGERKVADVLEKYNIEYGTEKRYKDCKNIKPLPFDFFLPQYNCCIEYDGYHHYHESRREGAPSLETVQLRDSIKTKYCEDNNIQLIRIPYWETQNIEKIITENLGIVQLEDIV